MTSGTFTIPTTGETAANVWYRIYLTVRDSAGHAHDRAARRAAAQGHADTGDQSGRTSAQAGRPADSHAHLVRGRRRHRPLARSCRPDVGNGHVRVRVLVGRWRRRAQRQHARHEHDLHRNVPAGGDGRRRPVGHLLQQRGLQRDDRHAHRSRDRFHLGHRLAGRRALAPTPSAHDGPGKSKRRIRGPTPSTRSATMACGCG